jgi:CheY-like chemotaxis protein
VAPQPQAEPPVQEPVQAQAEQPTQAPAKPQPQKQDDKTNGTESNTILYIEDNSHNRRIVRKILEHQGFDVREAEDGLEGYEMIRSLHPPLVLLDIALPTIDGLEILRRLQTEENEHLNDIPVIALTASAMRGDRERFLEAGCTDYLSKPIRAADLINMVQLHHPHHA